MAVYKNINNIIQEVLTVKVIPDNLYGRAIQKGIDLVMDAIKNEPVADVIEVSQCEKCKYRTDESVEKND